LFSLIPILLANCSSPGASKVKTGAYNDKPEREAKAPPKEWPVK